MAADIASIAQVLDATLDHKQHRKAESLLKQEEKKPQYSLQLLKIVAGSNFAVTTRLAAALAFKNYVRLNYVDEDGNHKLPAEEVATIKQELVGLMILSPPNIQTQLGEAISVIADYDFWKRWDTLIQDLVSRISTEDFKVTNGVLEVAHSIFVRWRPLFQSNELYEEVNHVVQHFGEAFIADQQIEANKSNATQLKGWFETLGLLVKILYDLTCHDLAPIIESNLQSILSLLDKYLAYTNPIFDGDDDEATALENAKADICEALTLFTTKYDEDFSGFCERFITSAWNLLSNLGPEKRYDLVVSRALQFLTAVASVSKHAQAFNDENTLGQIVEKVILSNVTLRESDIEMFEDEPIEFIRRDLEGSDTDSRRRAATDFLRQLLEKFEPLVTQVVFRYIDHYLKQGETDWKAKDTAIYLYLAIAAKGAVTAAQGVKTVNSHVNVVEFFQNHIAADLLNDGVAPISKVDAIKYLHNFRSQLTKDQWLAAFQPLIKNLASDNYVVYTYAAIAVERVLYLSNDAGEHLFSRADIEPVAKDLLDHLFNLIEKDKAPAKMQENEYLMQCIMRVLIVINTGVQPIIDGVLDHLISIISVIKANPSNPRFYYYLFEAIGALVRFSDPSQEAKLHARLWEPFSYILNEDVSEFVPYVFQVFAALLEAAPTSPLPAEFSSLLGPILAPTVWETRGNVPGCARFLSAMIPRAKQTVLESQQLVQILGIFQRLFSSKKTETNAFDILESVVATFDGATLDAYFADILTLTFTKLQANPSDSHKQRFVRFYHLVSARTEAGMGADYFINQSEKLQPGIFKQLYPNVILTTTKQLARPVDRKLGVISYTKTLCDSAAFAQQFQKGWANTANHLLELLQNPPKVAGGFGDEIITEADVDDIGFGVGFTPLNTCKRGPRDDFPQIDNVQAWVSEYLKAGNARQGGTVLKFVQERMQPEAQAAIAPYLQ
ncbi:importin alpha re-exporter [Diaporthe amygdali]|uniref:importin alpha re-exporter n=1 Tax=Phomopsis amygdali TaxID=1214568 RepID=UPI0022FDDD69|nr:importin alpha re-exporter [Diaporthe amygdali]KAJ0114953.1 importin alpha re-exporter [Diaporthe amygdali]